MTNFQTADSRHNSSGSVSTSLNTRTMVQTAVLTALLILMAFTPLGYLRLGVVSITFLTIPVVIGAIINGPGFGAFLGAVFGATSFAQCFGIDPFGTALMSINPFLTFVMCMVPRIIMGYAAGHIFRLLSRHLRRDHLAYALSALSGAVLNTVLFVGALIWFFGRTELLGSLGSSIIAILAVLITHNALIEAIVSMIAGGAIARTLAKAFPSIKAAAKS